jgi:predicted kinase
MVRAKVAALQRSQQEDRDAREVLERRVALHVRVGEELAADPRPVLVLMHGVSGSGKSHHAISLADGLGAVHLRSDVERKRLFGLDPLTRGGAEDGLYTPAATTRTYAHLAAVTEELLDAGLSVIVDATFLERERRAGFTALGKQAGVPVVVVDCEAPTALLRERLRHRNRRGDDPSDADEAVLDRQERSREPLRADEPGFTRVPADAGTAPEQLLDAIEKVRSGI